MTNRNVLITGASTGIGYSIATYLAKNNLNVIAGARKESDITRLSEIEGITGIKLEVTNTSDIENVVSFMERIDGVDVLINNAGIGGAAALLDTPLDQHHSIFNINVFSHLSLVKAFFEQLKNNKGHIINISSISSFMGSGAYSASKRSVDTYSMQMDGELKRFGIRTSIINPGFFESAIFESSRSKSALYQENTEFYGDDYDDGRKTFDDLKNANIKDPIMVAEKALQLITMEKPPVYNIVGNRNEETWSFEGMMEKMKNMNSGLTTPWSNEELLNSFKDILEN